MVLKYRQKICYVCMYVMYLCVCTNVSAYIFTLDVVVKRTTLRGTLRYCVHWVNSTALTDNWPWLYCRTFLSSNEITDWPSSWDMSFNKRNQFFRLTISFNKAATQSCGVIPMSRDLSWKCLIDKNCILLYIIYASTYFV